ncbi:hypothetical protein TUM3792_34210 [Shewanella sp. MBTL60-007]|nr:hypothetical protein TUM3792_34210 [Shewanella sp. MBTL60-007]
MIKTLMLTAALFQPEIAGEEQQDTLIMDKQAIVAQIESQLDDSISLMTQNLLNECNRLKANSVPTTIAEFTPTINNRLSHNQSSHVTP